MKYSVDTPRYNKIVDEHDSPNFQAYRHARLRGQRSPKSPLQYYETFSTPTKSEKRSNKEIINEFMNCAKENFNINDIEYFLNEIQEAGFLKLASPHLFSSDGEKNGNGLPCMICHEKAKNLIVTKCGHSFCNKCIHLHMKDNSQCPICTRKISESDIIPVLERSNDPNAAGCIFYRNCYDPGKMFFLIFVILTIFFIFKLQ